MAQYKFGKRCCLWNNRIWGSNKKKHISSLWAMLYGLAVTWKLYSDFSITACISIIQFKSNDSFFFHCCYSVFFSFFFFFFFKKEEHFEILRVFLSLPGIKFLIDCTQEHMHWYILCNVMLLPILCFSKLTFTRSFYQKTVRFLRDF